MNPDRSAKSEVVPRDLGEQPIARLMAEHGLAARDLVKTSAEPITFKMVSRACKGRRLTPHVQARILRALNAAAGTHYALPQAFTY